MMASAGVEAFDDPGWAFEPKWDGVRALVVVGAEGVRLISRNGNDISGGYPELGTLGDMVPAGSILDGEIVAFKDGRPSFARLQSRMHVRDATRVRALVVQIPIVLMLFDLLGLGGESLVRLALSERRQLLEESVTPSDLIQLSPQVIGKGKAMFAAASAQRLEGVVAKRLDSRYEPGKRSTAWLKIKTVSEVDAVVIGWRPGSAGRTGSVGSLALGLYGDDGQIRYIGSVGSGFDAPTLKALNELVVHYATEAAPLEMSQVAGTGEINWMRPELVAVVEYREVTAATHLRAPVFKGMRTDKPPTTCSLDQLTDEGAGPTAS